MLGIFPLNLSAVLNGMGSGRRKRDVNKVPQRNRVRGSMIFKV